MDHLFCSTLDTTLGIGYFRLELLVPQALTFLLRRLTSGK